MLKTKDGYAKVIGTSYQGSSDYVLLSNGDSKAISSLSVNYASNADKLDGEHASSFVRAGHYESQDLNKLDTYSFIRSVNSNNKDTSPKGNIGWYNVIQAVHRNGADDGPSYIGQIALGMTTNTDDMFFRGKRTDPWKTVIHSGNIGSQTVASATKLVTARKIWGQSFNGTADVNGTIYINNGDSENGAIILNNNINTHARISAIGDQVVFNTGSALRFGGTEWEYSDWAGLKYDTVANTIYMGIADGTVFNYYSSKRSNGTLKLPGITTITTDPEARIGNSGGNLYLGNANNSAWLYVQNMASQVGEANWKIYTNGTASFKNLTVDGSTVINGPTTLNSVTTLNGLVTNNRGILPASYDVNKNNTACYVWGDAMSTGVTAITDALDPKYVSVHYSLNNGTQWLSYRLDNQRTFNLYANNGNRESIYLGANVVSGSIEPSSLTQIQKNQLMVTFEIPDSLYSQLCWASVEINEGVETVCTVEIIAEDGTIKNTFTKNMIGWSMVNYINFWGGVISVVNIGQDSARFVRFKFKHDAGNTQVRNAQILKIRLFSFTKYNLNINDRCSLMAYTGHLYTYDQNLNVKFPNALNVGGTLTITPTSNGYYEEANYPGAVIDTYYNNNYLQIGKSNGELILDTNSDKGNINPAFYIKDFISANRLFKFNTGLAVPPVHLMNDSNADGTITIQNEKYNAYYVGTQENAIGKSFILADNSINYKQVIVIRKGVDGEVCFIKDAGEETFRYYLQDTQLMLAGDHTIQKSGTFSYGFDDNKARFIIYSVRNNTWYEFYCG